MHANQGSLPQHYQPIPIDTTHVNPTQYNWTNVSLSGKTARSIQHRSNIKSVDLGPMPMPISRKFTSSDKMPILHMQCQYFTNLPIHNQSCPNTGQYIWTIVLLSFGTSLYGGKAISLDGGRFGGHHNTTSRSIEHNKNTNPTDI